ncbi:hypothetical protein P7C73_g4221, partial [Tremellales sp. Uapishka_1]
MQALRTLPILNRPSRASSPAPQAPAVQPSQPVVAQPMGPPSDTNQRSRSLSRQVQSSLHISSAPPAAAITPPGSRPVTPRMASTALPTEHGGGPQGGFMDVLGLRLNEIVNKACLGVDWKAKKCFKKGSGWSVGEAVVNELPNPPSDAYLMRAILRTSVRALSIYLSRLESLLLPALTDASFVSPLNLTSPTAPMNPAHYFAVSIAHAAWETCEVLEQTLETGKWPKFVSETLRPVMDKFDLVVGKVIQPLLLGLKRDLVASLTRTEGTSPPGGKVVGLATVPAPTSGVAMTKEASVPPISRLTKENSQAGTARTLTIPPCLQHFAARVDAAHKVLELVGGHCQDDGEGWVTGVVVAVIWKGMCGLSERDALAKINRPPSPGSVAKALTGLAKAETTPTVVAAPSFSKLAANPLSILPSRAASRPPSPPRSQKPLAPRTDELTHALLSFEGLIKRLYGNLVQPPSTAPPVDPNSTEHLAREALSEALEALVSMRTITAVIYASPAKRLLVAVRRLRDDIDLEDDESLDDALEDIPSVLLFTLLWKKINAQSRVIKTPMEVWGWSLGEYERQVLGGFGSAEDWARRVALALKPEVERCLIDTDSGETKDWLHVLGVGIEARTGVKVVGAI